MTTRANNWNHRQRIARLEREIAHFRAQVARYPDPQTRQEKRIRTIAMRCLKRRECDLLRANLPA